MNPVGAVVLECILVPTANALYCVLKFQVEMIVYVVVAAVINRLFIVNN